MVSRCFRKEDMEGNSLEEEMAAVVAGSVGTREDGDVSVFLRWQPKRVERKRSGECGTHSDVNRLVRILLRWLERQGGRDEDGWTRRRWHCAVALRALERARRGRGEGKTKRMNDQSK